MAQDVTDLVRGTKIRDLIFTVTRDACKQMVDVWPVLGEEERARMDNLIEQSAQTTEAEIARRVELLLDRFIASGQPSVAAAEKGISIEGSGVTIKLAAVRAQVPQEFFTHKGSFLIVLNDCEALSLEELNRQGDFFAEESGPSPAAQLADGLRADSPIVAQFKASQTANGIEYDGAPIAPIPETTAELFRDEFLIAISQITGPEVAARYDEGGEFAGLVELYHGEAWTPTAAAINESLAPGEQRLITDGPPRVNAPGAADGGDADDPGVNPSENAGE